MGLEKNKLIYTNIGLPPMSIRNKEILVTGGAGFIGSNLVNTLSRENHVYALDDLQTGSVHNLDDSIGRIEFIKDKVKNINDYEINPDYIFHIGIYSSSPMYKNNPHLMANAIDDLITLYTLNFLLFSAARISAFTRSSMKTKSLFCSPSP